MKLDSFTYFTPAMTMQEHLKRAFDLACTTPAVVILSPVFAVLALWVRLDSPGPVVFRQQRVGRGGRLFWILKFRTMHGHDEQGPKITSTRDKRITRSGNVLRKLKLDELPQLINVLRGDMSLVGPRPEVPEYVAFYPPLVRDEVLRVRPGITDLASIRFRNEGELLATSDDAHRMYVEEILPKKLALHQVYVKRHSLPNDIWIILKTLAAVARA